jgi:hypothetical protein
MELCFMDFYDPFRNCACKQYQGNEAAIAGEVIRRKNFFT